MGMFEMICTVLDRVRKHGEDFERIHTAWSIAVCVPNRKAYLLCGSFLK